MVINWLGQACFKIQSGEFVMVIDPFSKEIGFVPPRFRADAVLVTHAHFDHSNSDSLTGDPFIISGPGEYEVKGIYVEGIETFHDASRGKERGMNTVYRIELEGLRLAHLGDFGESAMRDETVEALGDIDILMLPVGGRFTVDADAAAKVVKQIEPRYVIPMHFKIPGLKINLDSADAFLKEMGAAKIEAQEKFVIKKKDIGEEEKTEVVLLKPS
ncbi:MAG: MBL fold metallo-hydrolase [Candidatus Sungbacteria bacterium]|nr:MBL fold metallo-hydrolase [Candidatus Sungbacteria bacterium]